MTVHACMFCEDPTPFPTPVRFSSFCVIREGNWNFPIPLYAFAFSRLSLSLSHPIGVMTDLREIVHVLPPLDHLCESVSVCLSGCQNLPPSIQVSKGEMKDKQWPDDLTIY
mmetsp:Transcript_22429/g.44442  ORF Transcript_22429/g.44442 Transcript_22429/m.44442 type:complete len:111 (+) Transcript_22429:438-770(+)